MNKDEIAKKIKGCENELAKLRKELNQPEYSGKRWKPMAGDVYFFIDNDGKIRMTYWGGTTDSIYVNGNKIEYKSFPPFKKKAETDEGRYAVGNVFSTALAAEFEAESRRVVAELSDYAEGADAVWDGTESHYRLYCNGRTNCIEVCTSQYFKFADLYFPSLEAAEAAVEAVGEERVKKYYLGVKE